MIDQTQTPIVTTVRPRSRLRPLRLRSVQAFQLALIFLAGLLLGWLVLGWVVWPVEWIDAVPANLRAADQRQFIILVAGEYAQSRDAAQAQQRLASWDEASLATLLAVMEQEAVNEATVTALVNLRQALAVPQAELTFWDTLLEQKLMVLSAVLGGLILLTAVALTFYPSMRRNQKRRARQRQLEAEEEALLQAARAAQLADATAQAAAETAAATPTNQPAVAETAVQTLSQPAQPVPEAQPAQPQQPQAEPPQTTAPAGHAQNEPKQPLAANPGEPPTAPANQPQPETAVPAAKPLLTEEEEEDEQGAADNAIQDILNSVFEDDDDAAHYESLLKGLDDINIMKLIKDVDQVAQQLRERRPKGKTAAPVRSNA
ncbi:MAG: hypothetical protein CL608_33095 [Anaerolineaceae bacterium]|nr:hypothetical protein [Anaerolineaceae bacterium]